MSDCWHVALPHSRLLREDDHQELGAREASGDQPEWPLLQGRNWLWAELFCPATPPSARAQMATHHPSQHGLGGLDGRHDGRYQAHIL